MNLTSLAMWQPSILETYGDQATSYVNQRSGPLRLKYPHSLADMELISSLAEVYANSPNLRSNQLFIRIRYPTMLMRRTLPS